MVGWFDDVSEMERVYDRYVFLVVVALAFLGGTGLAALRNVPFGWRRVSAIAVAIVLLVMTLMDVRSSQQFYGAID